LARSRDDVMVWISQLIDQDVNVFAGARLAATSERDLFASGLLPERTPDDVYRAIALQRLPRYVGEDHIGTFPYMIAAAPVRAGAQDGILTVPLTNRQRDIEREIDELDRGVHLAALCFILLGAGIGLSMAERIADPVRRLTRATRQIARGDFDARIAVRSADELRRLVDAFNSMASELKAQRAQLERTHRLEAWAEMARQVAHEIKNPLTPIQLSAEHLRRVHADRGEPLGEVLEGCVSAILGQVTLLRRISAEFSSFASAPTAKPAPVDVAELVAEVVEPYRAPLAGRIDVVNRVAPPLPPAFVDRTLIARALVNIVENALHAMPGRGSLRIDAIAEGDRVVIEVRDSGLGMDEEALARAFEPYFSTKTTGTGLGLPIALRNVEVNGGTLDVESRKGEGTTVRMTLPTAAPIAEGRSLAEAAGSLAPYSAVAPALRAGVYREGATRTQAPLILRACVRTATSRSTTPARSAGARPLTSRSHEPPRCLRGLCCSAHSAYSHGPLWLPGCRAIEGGGCRYEWGLSWRSSVRGSEPRRRRRVTIMPTNADPR
jgi:signal transduction histidine kinase